MKNEQTAVIKDMEFLLNELHKEWERPGEVKSSVSIPYEKVEEISRKLNVIVYETQQSADSDGLAFKQSIAKSKQCYVLLRIMRKIVKGKGKCDRQAVDAEFVIELDGEESKLFKEMFAELLKSDVGIMASITIIMCVVISVFMGFWVRKQVKKDELKQQQNQHE